LGVHELSSAQITTPKYSLPRKDKILSLLLENRTDQPWHGLASDAGAGLWYTIDQNDSNKLKSMTAHHHWDKGWN
jgi:hypothetical protein